MLYGLPLSSMLAGGWLAVSLGLPEWQVVTAAVLGLGSGLFLARRWAQNLEPRRTGPYISDIRVNREIAEES